jgi:plasmid stabilization system protein ParE
LDPTAVSGLEKLLDYLRSNWTEKEILKLETKLSSLLRLISQQPELFPPTKNFPHIHKALVDKNNYLIYRKLPDKEIIEIINFRGTKQYPIKE